MGPGHRWSRSAIALRVTAVLAALALVAGACSSDGDGDAGADADVRSGDGDLTQVAVAGIPPFSVTAWPLVVADEQGYFEEEGIEVEKTFTFDGLQLLVGDRVDVINDGGDSGLLAVQRGKDAIAFSPLAGTITDGLLVSDDVDSVQDFEGETLRTSGAGSTDEYLLQRYLEANGVDPESVDYVGVEDDGAALAQLDRGRIKGGMFDQGILLDAEEGNIDGAKELAAPADFGVYPWNLLQTTREYAEDNPEVMVGFIRAIQRAIVFIQDPANKSAVVKAVRESDKSLKRSDIQETYDAAQGFGLYVTAPLTPDDVRPALDFLKATLDEPIDVDLEEFIDNQYVEQAQAE